MPYVYCACRYCGYDKFSVCCSAQNKFRNLRLHYESCNWIQGSWTSFRWLHSVLNHTTLMKRCTGSRKKKTGCKSRTFSAFSVFNTTHSPAECERLNLSPLRVKRSNCQSWTPGNVMNCVYCNMHDTLTENAVSTETQVSHLRHVYHSELGWGVANVQNLSPKLFPSCSSAICVYCQ